MIRTGITHAKTLPIMSKTAIRSRGRTPSWIIPSGGWERFLGSWTPGDNMSLEHVPVQQSVRLSSLIRRGPCIPDAPAEIRSYVLCTPVRFFGASRLSVRLMALCGGSCVSGEQCIRCPAVNLSQDARTAWLASYSRSRARTSVLRSEIRLKVALGCLLQAKLYARPSFDQY